MKNLPAAAPFLLLLALGACSPGAEEAPAGDEIAETADGTTPAPAAGQDAVYAEIERHHQQMMDLYRERANALPPEVQELYRHMEEMHGRVGPMHEHMMGVGADGRGMMEGRMPMHGGMPVTVRGVREWDRQMLSMHEAMARWHRGHDDEEMAEIHQRMTGHYRRALEQESGAAPEEERAAPVAEEGRSAADGAALYAEHCASCHGSGGRGAAGVFPPLRESEWVTGPPERLARIVLHGLEGPIRVAGSEYEGTMPGFASRLSDRQLAALLTHLRTAWGHAASEVPPDLVRSVRSETEDRAGPFSASALE